MKKLFTTAALLLLLTLPATARSKAYQPREEVEIYIDVAQVIKNLPNVPVNHLSAEEYRQSLSANVIWRNYGNIIAPKILEISDQEVWDMQYYAEAYCRSKAIKSPFSRSLMTKIAEQRLAARGVDSRAIKPIIGATFEVAEQYICK